MTDFSNKKVLVIDTGAGLGIEHACRLGRDFSKVWYASTWQDGFPSFSKHAIGLGMEDIEKVRKPFDYIDKADLIFFPDVGFGDVAEYLRKQGHAVFGAGKAEILEEDRDKGRKIQEKIGLPVQETKVVKGVSELRQYLQKHDNCFVKLNIYRGDLETFYCKDYESVEIIIDEIESNWGPFKEEFDFMVEDCIDDAIEIGLDGFHNGKDFIRPCLWGVEKGQPYIGRYDDELPEVLEDFMEAANPVFTKLGYRGAFSNEERITDKETGYMIDYTARFAYPLSLAVTESIENYSEVIWAVANGEDVKLKPTCKYVACAPMISTHTERHWLRLMFDKKLRNRVKLQCCSREGGYYYCVKGSPNGAILIGLGDSVDDCIEEIEENSHKVDAHELGNEQIFKLKRIKEDLEKLEEMGIEF